MLKSVESPTRPLTLRVALMLTEDHRTFLESGIERWRTDIEIVQDDPDLVFVDDANSAIEGRKVLIHAPNDVTESLVGFVDFCSSADACRLDVIVQRELADHRRRRDLQLRAEQAETNNRFFQQMFETNLAIKLLIDPESGQFIDVNESACRFYGYSKKQMLTMKISDINVLTVQEINTEMQRAKLEKKLFFRFKHRLRDGCVRDVEVYSGPIQFEHRRVLFSIVVDVTEREQALAALKTSVENFKALFDHNPDGMFLVDGSGEILDVNPAGLTLIGYERDESLTLNVLDLWPEDQRAQAKEHFQLLLNGDVIRSERRLRHKNGHTVDSEVHANCLPDGRILGLVRDLSLKKQAQQERLALEERLRQSQKLESVGRLAGGIAHDINNLLSPILGYAELGAMRVADGEKNDAFQRIIDAAERARDLMSRLLAFSRKQVLDRKNVDMNLLIDQFSQLMGRIIGEEVNIQLNLAQDLPIVYADPGQVEQVLLNLVINARDALNGDGSIQLSTRQVFLNDSEFVEMAVSDDGMGMEPEVLEHALEPFYTTKPASKGTGLGLAVVHGIVSQHGGHLDIESDPGKGTVVRAWFPAASGAVAADQVQTTPRKLESGGGEHIVLVEDDPTVQRFLVEGLRYYGYRVDAFVDPRAMLHWLSRTPQPNLDLIITDVVMPSMRGPALVREVTERIGRVRALFISGYPESTNIERLLLARNHSFLRKPFSINELLTEVRKLLQTDQSD